MPPLTIGEFRVGVNFNPSTKPEVADVKNNTSRIITDLVQRSEAEDASEELSRTAKTSATEFETATALAVKAYTTNYDEFLPDRIGEFRVALGFNPSGNPLVHEFKSDVCALINKVELKLRKRYAPYQLKQRANGEFHRHCSLASTFLELASIYSTKAAVLDYTQCPEDLFPNEKAEGEVGGDDVVEDDVVEAQTPAEFDDDTNSE